MPVVVYSVLRLALLAVSWLLLTWAGLHPLAALLVAAFVAWGLSYAALGGPRDAAARYLAERAAVRAAHAGRPVLSAHAREDADVEDAAVDAALPSDAVPTAGAGGTGAAAGTTADVAAPTAAPGDVQAGEPVIDQPVADENAADGPQPPTGTASSSRGTGAAQSASASPSSMP